jgi:hypothetical protein
VCRIIISDHEFPAVIKRDHLFYREHGFLVYPERSFPVLQNVNVLVLFKTEVFNIPPEQTIPQAGREHNTRVSFDRRIARYDPVSGGHFKRQKSERIDPHRQVTILEEIECTVSSHLRIDPLEHHRECRFDRRDRIS